MHADGTIDLGGSDRLAILLDPSSSAFKKFENDAYLVMENGNLVLMATASKDNKYARLADTFNSGPEQNFSGTCPAILLRIPSSRRWMTP